ncbi:MAG TPA: hypothetical protein VN408_35855 [Actinoplanes sp.]|nr:hypothetical protein [Actinoplanes sp.]
MLVFRTPLITAMALIISASVNVSAAFASPSSPAHPSPPAQVSAPARASASAPAGGSAPLLHPLLPHPLGGFGGVVPSPEIPDRAMLRPADLGGAKPYPVDGESWPRLRPPRPCGAKVPVPSAERAVSAVIDADQAPVVVLEYLARHHTEQAARDYLSGLRTALRGCDDKTWKLLSSGRDRLVLRWSQSWEHVDQQITHHTYVVVARTGPAIVVVADVGWETSDGDRSRAELIVTRAVKRASTLR